jgi:hypothetical protein
MRMSRYGLLELEVEARLGCIKARGGWMYIVYVVASKKETSFT